MKWATIFSRLEAQFTVEKLPPVSTEELAAVVASLKLPVELIELYDFTNGISYEWFRILPIFVVEKPKRTWDSLQKARVAVIMLPGSVCHCNRTVSVEQFGNHREELVSLHR